MLSNTKLLVIVFVIICLTFKTIEGKTIASHQLFRNVGSRQNSTPLPPSETRANLPSETRANSPLETRPNPPVETRTDLPLETRETRTRPSIPDFPPSRPRKRHSSSSSSEEYETTTEEPKRRLLSVKYSPIGNDEGDGQRNRHPRPVPVPSTTKASTYSPDKKREESSSSDNSEYTTTEDSASSSDSNDSGDNNNNNNNNNRSTRHPRHIDQGGNKHPVPFGTRSNQNTRIPRLTQIPLPVTPRHPPKRGSSSSSSDNYDEVSTTKESIDSIDRRFNDKSQSSDDESHP